MSLQIFISVNINIKSFNYEKVIQANSTYDFDFANEHDINYFPFYSCWNVKFFGSFFLFYCVILLAVSGQLFSHTLWDTKNSWKPFASVCGKASNSWKLICFEFTASCCLFRSPRLCGTSTLNYSILGECGDAGSSFRCAGCVSKLAPLLSHSKKSGELLFLLASCWYYWGWYLVWLSKHEVVQQLFVLAQPLVCCPSSEGLPSVCVWRPKLSKNWLMDSSQRFKFIIYNFSWVLPNLPLGHSILLNACSGFSRSLFLYMVCFVEQFSAVFCFLPLAQVIFKFCISLDLDLEVVTHQPN